MRPNTMKIGAAKPIIRYVPSAAFIVSTVKAAVEAASPVPLLPCIRLRTTLSDEETKLIVKCIRHESIMLFFLTTM